MARLFTQKQAAAMLGVSQAAISKAVRSGRLQTVEDVTGQRGIDADTLLEQWNATAQRPVRLLPNGSPRHGPLKNNPDRLGGVRNVAAVTDVPDYSESRARTEFLKAELLELERRQKEAQLLNAEEVKAEAFRLARAVRDAMMNIPDRVSAEIAGEMDARNVHALLTDEIRKAMESLIDG